jgi:hypothetical protein
MLCFAFIFLVSISSTYAGCQQYNINEAAATAAVCIPFLSPNIYVPINEPFIQTSIDIFVNTTQLWMIRAAYPVLSPLCYKYLISLTCHAAFPTCSEIITASNETVQVGVPQCRSVCETAAQVCGSSFPYRSIPHNNVYFYQNLNIDKL